MEFASADVLNIRDKDAAAGSKLLQLWIVCALCAPASGSGLAISSGRKGSRLVFHCDAPQSKYPIISLHALMFAVELMDIVRCVWLELTDPVRGDSGFLRGL
jgi:hypothetical protein